jgi:EpsI family protein
MAQVRIRIIILIALFGCASWAARAASHYRSDTVRHPPDWAVLPYQLGEWRGWDEKFDPMYGKDPSDSMTLRTYEGKGHKHVFVYIGYYADLPAIMEIHNPEICYPAQGWSIVSHGESNLALYRGKPHRAQQMLVSNVGNNRLVMWWYNVGSHPFEDRLRYVYVFLAFSSLQGRTDGSLVRLEAPLEGEEQEAARIRLERFRNDFLPALDRALPR